MFVAASGLAALTINLTEAQLSQSTRPVAKVRSFFGLLILAMCVHGTPHGFPSSGNGLWCRSPGTLWSKEWLPIGNGYLAGLSL